MRRMAMAVLATVLLAGILNAQPVDELITRQSIDDTKALTGVAKIRFLLQQIDLTAEQREYADGLLASLGDAQANQQLSLAQIRQLVAELQEAKADGDSEREKQIADEMRQTAKGYDPSEEFFMNMEGELTDVQRQRLEEARARLERNPSGAVRPIDAFRAARDLDLTKEQGGLLLDLQQKFRERMGKSRKLDIDRQHALFSKFLDDIFKLLTPEQQTAFRARITALRPDLPADVQPTKK